MATTLKLRRIGNSVGVVLPKELLTRLGAREGDELLAIDTPSGIQLNKADTEFDEHMKLVEKIMERYPKTLWSLAK